MKPASASPLLRLAVDRWTRWRGRSRWSQSSPKAARLEARRCSGRRSRSRRRAAAGARASRIAAPGRGRCSSECQKTTAAQVAVALDLPRAASSRKSARGAEPRSSPVASRPASWSASSSVPSPAPTSRTGPGGRDLVDPGREQARACGRGWRRRREARSRFAGRRGGTSRRRRPRAPSSSGQGSVVAAPQARAAGRGRGSRARAQRSSAVRRTRRRSRRSGTAHFRGERQTAHDVEGLVEVVVAQLEVVGRRSPRREDRRRCGAGAASSRRAAAWPASAPAGAAAAGPWRASGRASRAPRRRSPCSARSRTSRGPRPRRSARVAELARARSWSNSM